MTDTLNGRTLIASHRGAAGGNIPFNTTPAFECALRQKADILELDVSKSLDGTLYVFHPKLEPVFLGSKKLISEMHDDEVALQRNRNTDQAPTQYGVERLEPVLENLRGRCRINIDKFWVAPLEIAALVRSMGMQDQVIVKSNLSAETVKDAAEYASDLPYMPIVRENDTTDEFMTGYRGRWVGVETCFSSEENESGTEAFVRKMHAAGRLVWVNAIVYNYKKVLSGGHNDDLAAAGDMDGSWGWLAERGYDIVQTDFPLLLHTYLTEKGYR